jgi:hypothetical protein
VWIVRLQEKKGKKGRRRAVTYISNMDVWMVRLQERFRILGNATVAQPVSSLDDVTQSIHTGII